MPEPITLVTVPQFERNLAHPTGTDKSFKITVRNLDGVTPTNITSWTMSFVIHAYGDPNIVFVTKTVGSGITISNATAGELTVTVSASDVSAILPGEFSWKLERIAPDSSTFVIGKGNYSMIAK